MFEAIRDIRYPGSIKIENYHIERAENLLNKVKANENIKKIVSEIEDKFGKNWKEEIYGSPIVTVETGLSKE